MTYRRVDADTLPPDLIWHVPPQHQGQIIEAAYAEAHPVASAACDGARYKKITDRSVGPCASTYYCLDDDDHS